MLSESDPVQLYKGYLEYTLRSKWNRPENLADDSFSAEVGVDVDAHAFALVGVRAVAFPLPPKKIDAAQKGFAELARRSPLGRFAEGHLRVLNAKYPAGEPEAGIGSHRAER